MKPNLIVLKKFSSVYHDRLPQFSIGFKERPLGEREQAFRPILLELLLDMLTSDVSAFYRRLYDGGVINDAFSNDVMTFREHCTVMFRGESREP